MNKIKKLLPFVLILTLSGCATYRQDMQVVYEQQAYKMHDRGEFKESNLFLSIIEKERFLSDKLIILKSKNFYEIGEVDSAFKLLSFAIEQKPHSIHLLVALAQLQLNEGDLLSSEALTKKVIKIEHGHPQAIKVLGWSLIRQLKYKEAEEVLGRLISQNDPEVLKQLGVVYFKLGQSENAIQVYTKLFNTKKFKNEAAHNLASIYLERGDVARSNPYVNYLVSLNPNSVEVNRMMTKNLINIPQIDKLSILRIFNSKFDDDWGQNKYYQTLSEMGLKQDSLDYLASLWVQKKRKMWVTLSYANELKKEGNINAAKDILSIHLADTHDSKSSDAQILSEQLALISNQHVIADDQPERVIASVAETKEIIVQEKDQFYTVKKGDTLQSISQTLFGTTLLWRKILTINKDILKGRQELQIGLELLLPKKE